MSLIQDDVSPLQAYLNELHHVATDAVGTTDALRMKQAFNMLASFFRESRRASEARDRRLSQSALVLGDPVWSHGSFT